MDNQTPWTRPPVFVWIGLGVVLLAAAVLSFNALRELAEHVRIHSSIAWLFPVGVDAGAAVSCTVWLGRRTAEDAARYAKRLTCWLMVVTVAANAAGQGMTAAGVTPPWWVAVLVGAVPPAIVVATVHLLTLMVRRRHQPAATAQAAPTSSELDVRAERDRLAAAWKAENPGLGARALAPYLTEKGFPLSVSGAQSAYFTKSVS